MKQVIKFTNKELNMETRGIEINGEPYLVAKDIVETLGYNLKTNRYGEYVKKHVDEEDYILYNSKTRLQNEIEFDYKELGQRGGYLINESGFYALVLSSELPEAKKFKRWVTKEVLPQIRKTLKALELVVYTPNTSDLVKMRDGFCYTTCLDIANVFNKTHRYIRSIVDNYVSNEKMRKNPNVSNFIKSHVKEISYIDSQNRVQKSYELDEFAFNFIALSLQGDKADYYKMKFIEQFYNMRQALLNRTKALAIEQVLPQNKNLRQYVYLIENEDSKNIKIGVGQNPEQRLKQLQTGCDSNLNLIYKSMVCSNAYEIECFLHNIFKEYNVRGEWFNMKKEDILNELEQCEFVLTSEFNKFI